MKDEVCQYLYSGNFDTSFPLKADTKHAFICVKSSLKQLTEFLQILYESNNLYIPLLATGTFFKLFMIQPFGTVSNLGGTYIS